LFNYTIHLVNLLART